MSPDPRRGSRTGPTRRRRAAILPFLLVAALLVLGLAGCGRFDPTGPCTSDGTAPGAYPELEAMVPKLFRGAAPGQVDSGRTCSTDGLASLKGHGIDELRYAGSTWETGDDSGLSLATFASPGATALRAEWVSEFYENGARNGKNIDAVDVTTYPVADGISGRKIDVLNDESYQTVVVWDRRGRTEVALVASFIREIQTKDAHERVVREAVDAWLAADGVLLPAGSAPASVPATSPTPTS